MWFQSMQGSFFLPHWAYKIVPFCVCMYTPLIHTHIYIHTHIVSIVSYFLNFLIVFENQEIPFFFPQVVSSYQFHSYKYSESMEHIFCWVLWNLIQKYCFIDASFLWPFQSCVGDILVLCLQCFENLIDRMEWVR